MEPHQERMYIEFKELNDRVTKLTEFIYNETYKKFNLSEDEIVDMRCQLYAMQSYREALGRRCVRQGIDIPNKSLFCRGEKSSC